MAKGILGIIACPKLEDELIYSIMKDPEDKNVIVIDSPYNYNLIRKLEKKGISFEKIDELDFLNNNHKIDQDEFTIAILINDPKLHMEPKDLQAKIQEQLFSFQGCVDAVGIYYGSCGNLGWDVSKWADEHISYPVTAFRDREGRLINNCIGVAVGGTEGYRKLVRRYRSSLFVTPATAADGEESKKETDRSEGHAFDRTQEESRERMKKILREHGYKYAVQIDTGLDDRDEFDKAIKKYADDLELEIIQADPGFTDIWPTDNMYKECKARLG